MRVVQVIEKIRRENKKRAANQGDSKGKKHK